MLSDKAFEVNQYTSSSEAKKADMPGEVYVVTLGSDGNLKYTKKILETVDDVLAALNQAASAVSYTHLDVYKRQLPGSRRNRLK